jgi:hypothetical protein
MQPPHEGPTGWSVSTRPGGLHGAARVWLKVAAPRAIPCISLERTKEEFDSLWGVD